MQSLKVFVFEFALDDFPDDLKQLISNYLDSTPSIFNVPNLTAFILNVQKNTDFLNTDCQNFMGFVIFG